MKNITVYILVYNEEARIENLLKNCLWSDDIIIYDKSSTDRTREIASKYHCRIIKIPYSDTGPGMSINVVNDAKNDWILGITCSDIIHPKLIDKMLELINREGFDYDVIAFPYVVGVLGIIDKRSPWSAIPLKKYLFKKTAAIFSDIVHKEISFKPYAKIYKMEKNDKEAVFHLTHENLDIFFERVTRYAKGEAMLYSSMNKGLIKIFLEIWAAIFWMIFYKRVLFMGWKGFVLFYAFLIYFFTKFLFTWERFNGKGKEVYDKLRNSMLKEWSKDANSRSNDAKQG